MTFAEKFNTGKRVFDVNTDGFTFAKLQDIPAGEIVRIDGLYIHAGKIATQPVAICAERKQLINFPAYMCTVVENVLSDTEAVESIKAGKVGFTTYEYVNEQYKRTCYGVAFVDM